MRNGRLLIIVGASKDRGKRGSALINVLSNDFGKTIYMSAKDLFRELSEHTNETKKIYLISNDMIPCSDSFCEIFEYMEKSGGVGTLWNIRDFCGNSSCNLLRGDFPFFLCIDTSSEDLKKITEQVFKIQSFKELSSVLSDYPAGESFFSVWAKKNSGYEDVTLPFMFNAKEYSETGFPFLPYVLFKLDRMDFIKYGTDNVPAEVFKSIIADREKRECLLEYFAEECDASRLKDLLHLNFIVPQGSPAGAESKKCAVFVHLYYERYFERYIEYLNYAANYLSVFISVNTQEKKTRLLSMANGTLRNKLTVVICENRGRDLSALLVAFKPYTTKYEYFCFLHDKSSHEDESETVGRAFSDCMWDNLLDSRIIPEVISFFEENPHIGLLVSPTPYWGVYLGLKSDFWTVCHNKTLELSKMLELNVKIDKEINPAALGTAFWCRTEALLPLLKYPWRYEDFDEEPLDIDGTISHALERILPYAALSRRFLTSWVVSEEYAPRILESHLLLTERLTRTLKQCPVPSAAGKTAEQIGVLGALRIFKESAALLFKSLGKYFLKRLPKKERN